MAVAAHALWLPEHALLAILISSLFIDGIRSQFSPPDSSSTSGFGNMPSTIRAAVIVIIVIFVLVLFISAFLIYKCLHIVDKNTRNGLPRVSIQTHLPTSQSQAPSGLNSLPSEVQEHLRKLCYTLDEVREMTDNFRIKLGEGGFGAVYHGKLNDGTQVAVKKLSTTSSQGPAEFLNEVVILSRARHKNLVSMIGYCCESNERCLIYEFMSNGNLDDRLHGLPSEREPLDWLMRLKVAIGAAKGFSYLHNDCDPPIIHRDVKSSNILLDNKFVAKVADFGLSKLVTESFITHVSTRVVGTIGYLDPEYAETERLTEKSDVYSFGVILLELITGKRARVQENGEYVHIGKWVNFYVMNNKIDFILDKHLGNILNKKSIQNIVDISLKCLASKGYERPHFNEVLQVLNASLEMEYIVNVHQFSTSTSHNTYSGYV